MNTKSINFLLALLLVIPVVAGAQTSPYPTTAPTVSKVIVESTYYFARRDYQPPVRVPNVGATARLDTPEGTVFASISAMKTKDFDWFRSMWDEPSRQMMEKQDRELGQTRETWLAAWEKVANRTAELTSRVDSGDFVIIAYRLLSPDPTEKPIELQTVLKAEGNRWLMTQEAASDPVLSSWRTPDARKQRVGRQLGTDDVVQ